MWERRAVSSCAALTSTISEKTEQNPQTAYWYFFLVAALLDLEPAIDLSATSTHMVDTLSIVGIEHMTNKAVILGDQCRWKVMVGSGVGGCEWHEKVVGRSTRPVGGRAEAPAVQ